MSVFLDPNFYVGSNSPWVSLLNMYQGIMDFESAYEHFDVGYTDSQLEVFDNKTFQELVHTATEDKISDRAHAMAVLGPEPGVLIGEQQGQSAGGTYFRATYTAFKSVGLVTAINVRWLDELKILAPADTAVKPDKKMAGLSEKLTQQIWPLEVEHAEVNSHPAAARGKWTNDGIDPGRAERGIAVAAGADGYHELMDVNGLYFSSPSVLRFLVRRGISLKQNGNKPFNENLYLQLAWEIYGMMKQSATLSWGPESPKAQGLARTQDALKAPGLSAHVVQHWDDKDNIHLKGFVVPDNATLREDEGGKLQPWQMWPSSNYDRHSKGTSAYSFPGITNQQTYWAFDKFNGSDRQPENIESGVFWQNWFGSTDPLNIQWRYKMFAIGTDGTNQQSAYLGWNTTGSPIYRIHGLIKQLIAKDLLATPQRGGKAPLAEIEGVDSVELALANRKQSRLQDILGFFGHGSQRPAGAAGAAANIQAATAAGVLEKIQPAKPNLTPIDYQCFLLEQIRNVAAAHRPDYKNIIRLDSNKQPALVQNKLSSTMDYQAVQQFLSICPNVQALLTPYLKVSRVTYDNQGKATGKELDLEIPNFVTPTDVSKITERGRLPGGGIKSFTWSLDGVQPAEVDNNISATLELYFQSVSDFFNAPAAGRPDRASYLDLVIASPRTTKNQGAEPGVSNSAVCTRKTDEMLSRQWRGDNYRIKVVAGWSTPDFPSLARAMSQDGHQHTKAVSLHRALEKSKITLFLQQTRHDFRFSEDGSLTLTVDYQAALSGIATSPSADIFGASSEAQMTLLKAAEEEVEVAKAKGSETTEERNNIKEKLEEVKKLRAQDRMIKYKKLLSRIFKSNKIYNMPVSPKELLLPPYSELTAEGRARRAKRRASSTVTTFAGGQSQNAQLLKSVSAAASGEAPAEETAENFSVGLQEKYDSLQENPDVIWISYFYLGDLLDTVLDQVKLNHDLEQIPFKFFLSDVEMIDPLVALKIKNLEDVIKCKQDFRDAAFLDALVALKGGEFTQEAGITQLMSIGDIPIAIDAFQVWFKDYVIKKDRDKYFFLHFVKDICAELITRALATKCFGPDVNITQRFDAQPITFKMGPKGRANLKGNEIVPAWAPVDNPSKYSLVESIRALKPTTSPEDTELAMVLISTDSKPKGLVGNYKHDTELGIYHQYLGSPCGLLKTMNFNREDQEYLREAKIQKEGALGPEQLRELYSADIDLYGNTLFKNGNYIYLDPKLMGSTEAQLRILGLHGYYLITGVSSTVTENSFDVSVKALHEGVAFRDEVLMSPETYTNLTAEHEPYMSPDQRQALAEAAVNEGDIPGGGTTDPYSIDGLEASGTITPDRAAFERRVEEYNRLRQQSLEGGVSEAGAQEDFNKLLSEDPYVIDQGGVDEATGLPLGIDPLPSAPSGPAE